MRKAQRLVTVVLGLPRNIIKLNFIPPRYDSESDAPPAPDKKSESHHSNLTITPTPFYTPNP